MEVDELQKLRDEVAWLREWVKANSRRLEDLEANAFFLEDSEEVILVTVPRRDSKPSL